MEEARPCNTLELGVRVRLTSCTLISSMSSASRLRMKARVASAWLGARLGLALGLGLELG